MPREDNILEYILLAHKQNGKLKTAIEEVSELNVKGRIRFRQLSEMDSAEIVESHTNIEIIQ